MTQAAPPSPAVAPARDGRPAVLVVDDVEANLVAVEAVLADLDCELVRARSGNAALRLLLKHEFAVILLDVQMPEMDGYEVARHSRANPATRDVPILFLTATHNTQQNVLRGYGSGAVDVLFKPIDSTILRSKVMVFLALYESKRQIARSKRELEQAYDELKAMQAQLVQSAKMASLGELVAGVAHEINNPLAFAIGHLDTVQRGLERVEELVHPEASPAAKPHWDKVKSRLGETDMGLKRIRDLVVRLRTFSRIDGGERGVANVKECVDSVLTILGYRLSDGIAVVSDLAQPESFECFPGLLNQALMNLIANAIDAVGGQGTITVASRTAGDSVVITVTDSGPGIPLPIRQRIFEPFFTTKPVGSGTGLGLSITYSIAERHGGTLGVECPPEGGTCMKLTLPLAGPPPDAQH